MLGLITRRSCLIVAALCFATAGCGTTLESSGLLGQNQTTNDGDGSTSTGTINEEDFGKIPTSTPEEIQSIAPYKNELTSEEAYHLLRRAAFGATPEQVAQAVERGLAATVDDLLTIKPTPVAVETLAAAYELEIPKRWMVHLIEGPNPLRERMAMFWHDRFAAARRVLTNGDIFEAVDHMERLRDNALGNYRDFLTAVTTDPMMMLWLNGADSPKDNPNENYAREFWELFTLGRDVVYTENDIKEAAKAFTGLTLYRTFHEATTVYNPQNHNDSIKSIFPGRAAAANYNYTGVIDLTLAQPEAARYVARNLFVMFVHDHPSDAAVQELADFFVAGNFEIAPVVRKLLTSEAFFSSDAYYSQISSPIEHYVGFARSFDMHMFSETSQGYFLDRVIEDLAAAGQELLSPPGVEGWKEDLGWLQDQWIINRGTAMGRTMDYGPTHTLQVPYHVLPAISLWNQAATKAEIVNSIARVLHIALTDAERNIYINVLDQNGNMAFENESPQHQPRHIYQVIRLMSMDERVICR